jgi:hypothetical protein
MKNDFQSITLALGFTLAASSGAHAMSEFASLSITPLWPTNSNPGNVVLYGVTVERSGSGLLSVDLSSTGLPTGTTVSFTYDPSRFTGNSPRFMYFIMAVTTTQPTPTDSFSFVVTGTARRESISVTNTVPPLLRVSSEPPLFVALDLRKNGNVELRGWGYTGESYRIEATDDLGSPDWKSVGISTADGNGRFTFLHEHAQSEGSAMQFYRAVKLGPSAP